VRFDRGRGWFPAQREGPSRFLPEIPETRGVDSCEDISPRMGAPYDLFGDGRTALKVYFSKYLEGAGVTGNCANADPSLRLPQTTSTFGTAGVTCSWTNANGNFVAAQDLRGSGGDLGGVLSNTRFGQYVLTNNFDPRVLNGWGVRPSDWNLSASFERQLRPGAAVSVSYVRRWFDGSFVADNLALQPADLTPYEIMAPLDPRLPGGGGYVVRGLYDVVPEKAGQVNNLTTVADEYGAWRQYFNGLDVTARVRVGRDVTFAGATSTGQTVADSCDVRARLPELATTTTTVNLVAPGTMRGDRINQLDARVAKILKLPRPGAMLALDICNAMNSGAVLTYNTTFVRGGPWLQPLTILTPRFFKITAEFEF
jgi:hypothetical protein